MIGLAITLLFIGHVVICEPLGLQAELGHRMQDELWLSNKTLRAYWAQQWHTCDVNLLNLSRMNPDGKQA